MPLCVGLAVVQTFAEFRIAALAANKPRRTRNDNECARDGNGNADDDERDDDDNDDIR